MVERLGHHRAQTVAGCRHGGGLHTGKPLQTADFGHLHHGRIPLAGVRRQTQLARRSRGIDGNPLESRGDDGLQRAVATVGNRALHRPQSRVGASDSPRHGRRSLTGRERSLELVGRDDDVAAIGPLRRSRIEH